MQDCAVSLDSRSHSTRRVIPLSTRARPLPPPSGDGKNGGSGLRRHVLRAWRGWQEHGPTCLSNFKSMTAADGSPLFAARITPLEKVQPWLYRGIIRIACRTNQTPRGVQVVIRGQETDETAQIRTLPQNRLLRRRERRLQLQRGSVYTRPTALSRRKRFYFRRRAYAARDGIRS